MATNHLTSAKQALALAESPDPGVQSPEITALAQIARAHAAIAIAETLQEIYNALGAIVTNLNPR